MTDRRSRVMSPLHVWLVEAVRQSGRTQSDLARETGMSEKHVSQMMTGVAEGSLTAWSALLIAAGVLGIESNAEVASDE